MNKQNISLFIVGILWLLSLVGCQKEPINNAIEQHWQLLQFTTLADQKTIQCERLYYSITRFVTTVEEKQGTHGYGAFVARTAYSDDNKTLILSDFKKRENTGDTGIDATIEQLMPFGINNPKETVFRIVKSSHNQLILESDYARLELKKF